MGGDAAALRQVQAQQQVRQHGRAALQIAPAVAQALAIGTFDGAAVQVGGEGDAQGAEEIGRSTHAGIVDQAQSMPTSACPRPNRDR